MASRIMELIETQIRQRTDTPALITSDGRLTYGELDSRATVLSTRLIREGLRPGDVVLVQAPRGLALGVAVLAILRAGGAFCIVDPRYPEERIRHMWRRSRARLALVTPDQVPAWTTPVSRVLVMTGDEAVEHTRSRSNENIGHEDAAYLVFTSGSTGGPKAISMPHRCLDNLIEWTLASTSSKPLRTLLFAPLGFDVFIQEVFTAWCSGGCLYAPADDERSDLPRILDLLTTWEIERLFVPPVVLSRLADLAVEFSCVPTSLLEVAAAGEALHITARIREFFSRIPECRLHNHYGPAETHVALAHTLSGPPQSWPDAPPIGLPIPGIEAHVRAPADPEMIPDGSGELWLAGVGLAHGYAHEPQLTEERFPVIRMNGRQIRMYRTGDLVAQRADGVLNYVGRTDDQLKIRGYRIEPGEVEIELRRHPQVHECAVVAWTPPHGERQLVAHVVTEPGYSADWQELRSYLTGRLPDYMVPRHIIAAESLPLSPNGKVDRRRLGGPVTVLPGGNDDMDDVQRAVAAIWSGVLGFGDIATDRHFMELGGTSLSAAVIITKVHVRFRVRIDMHEFLKRPTIGALSALILERIAI
ncbi:non-ribosomal peptide synthetase [Actinoallomurus purpureus]|uniref:non-ribosomal peptide synthetase n=1 Tax=Actinoallomurus purpureus TaxID=478114 RepID=UPI002093ED2C|nr:non-ribosomal peptide synthetase [Actinoallomurus purpureus]MCO6008062.1 non-ribosomal peptide synthetase [Actinoallomurus purpureus]